jgi:hypothetical protein
MASWSAVLIDYLPAKLGDVLKRQESTSLRIDACAEE